MVAGFLNPSRCQLIRHFQKCVGTDLNPILEQEPSFRVPDFSMFFLAHRFPTGSKNIWRFSGRNEGTNQFNACCIMNPSIQPTDFRFFPSDGCGRTPGGMFLRGLFPICGSNIKTQCQKNTMDMLTSWNYIWCTYYAFSLFRPSGSCKFFCFEYYTSNSNSKNGASRHHYWPVARYFTPWSLTWNLKRMVSIKGISFSRGLFSGSMLNFKRLSLWTFWSNFAFENDHKKELPGKTKSRVERNPDILQGWLYWWTLWKIELRIGVRHMKNLPTMEISWILTDSICTRPISGSLNQLPEIMEEKAVATWSW